jgi:branched-chain amino acid aminotransferase
MTTMVFRNGNWEESTSLEATHEVLTGQGLFETIFVKNQVPQFLDLHLARLRNSSEILGIPSPDFDKVIVGVEELLLLQEGKLGRLRITLFGGVPTPQLMLSLVEVSTPLAKVSVNISPWTRNEDSAIAGAKSTSYAENVVALNRAKENHFSETLFFNNAGCLCEAATSNIVIIIDGEAITPPLNSGCLPGITRGVLLEQGAMKEASIDARSLNNAGAAALLSSIRGVQPIHLMGERELNSSDKAVQSLIQQYDVRVAQDKENWAKLL